MAGIAVDPEWVHGYAKTVLAASERMNSASEVLQGEPLGAEAFGELGRTVHTADAYQRASTTLREQLSRAVDSLRSASDGLLAVVAHHTSQDDDSAGVINRTHQS